MARLLPPESANVGDVSREIGVSVQTLERWREDAQTCSGLISPDTSIGGKFTDRGALHDKTA